MRGLVLLLCFGAAAAAAAQDAPKPLGPLTPEEQKAAEAAQAALSELLGPSGTPGAVQKSDIPADDGAEIKFVKLMSTYEYSPLALADAGMIPPLDQPFQRYVAMPDKSELYYAAFTYGLNIAANRNQLLYRPARVADGALVRIDLRALAAQEKDFEQVFKTYESLDTLDKYFHAKAVVQLKTKTVKKKVDVAPYKASDGKTYTTKEIDVEEIVPETTLAPAQHANLPALQQLHVVTRSNVPLLRADQLVCILLGTIDNGRYYQFRGLTKSDKDLTAEQKALALVGADVNSVAKLRSDERIALLRSNVTGKPRAIEYFYSSGTRATLGPSLVTITRDYFQGDIDPRRHPLKNLLDAKHDGSELIAILPNGMPLFVILDGQRELADSAPDKLVTDRLVPAPHSTILQGAISCIRCHGPDEGYKPADNVVKMLMRNGLRVTGDASTINDINVVRQRVYGLYDGDVSEPLRIARTTQTRALWALTGNHSIPELSAKLASIYDEYMYAPVTPQRAVRELGYEVAEKDAIKMLNRIIPMQPKDGTGTSPESVITLSLRVSKPPQLDPKAANAKAERIPLFVNRDDWEQEFQDAMLRVLEEEIRTQKGHPAADSIPVKAVDELPKEETKK